MFKKDKSASDAFTLSLGGMTTITSFTAAPAIAHDRLRQVRVDTPTSTLPTLGRFWLRRVSRSHAGC